MAICRYNGVSYCQGSEYEEFPDEIMELPLSEDFIAKKKKTLSRPNAFMLYGKQRVDFFSTSELLQPSMKSRVQLIRARSRFDLIVDNLNFSLGFIDCLLYKLSFSRMNITRNDGYPIHAYFTVKFN